MDTNVKRRAIERARARVAGVEGEEENDTVDDHPTSSQRSVTTPSTPAVDDPMWYRVDPTPLPDKFEVIHGYQWDAVNEIMECYRRGKSLVLLDAPTGSGKTLIGELVRRLVGERAFYVCHSKTLQDQFVGDFRYASVVKGRGNYVTEHGPDEVTCADCTGGRDEPCLWCDQWDSCPYITAKLSAMMSPLAVLNTAYMLNEFNFVKDGVRVERGLGIVDEVDTLEGELMGFVEFYAGERLLRQLGLTVPKEGSHRKTLGRWVVDELQPAVREWVKGCRGGESIAAVRERLRAVRMASDVARLAKEVDADEGLTNWVRDTGRRDGGFVLKPVKVDDFGGRYVWGHSGRWLGMSATIVSPDEVVDSCGMDEDWEVVTVPATIPVENRRVIVAPVADMSRKGKEAGEWEHMARAIVNVLGRHEDERVIIHTVSYELAQFLRLKLSGQVGRRRVVTYTNAKERDQKLAEFRASKGAVMIASSMARGVDLVGEDCRVVVVAKVPFPYLGDRQVSERMHTDGGGTWYAVQTVRELVQMFGRAVRGRDDWAVGYLLDRQFVSNVWRKNRALIPGWFREGLDMGFPVRELLK